MMDKSGQIEVLRREHKAAVDSYDFDRAELIERQIQRLRTKISRDFANQQDGETNFSLDERRERCLGDSERTNAVLMNRLTDLQKRFHARYKQLQERHTQQLTDLALEHTMALERELQRPIPEVESILAQSKIYGRDHNYQMARSTYQEAMAVKNRICNRRKMECNAMFLRAERKLKERQAKELKLLEEKQEAAKEEVNQKFSKQKDIIDNRMKVQEIKASFKPGVERTTMRTTTSARRANSVSRMRTSRLSQNSRRF